MSLHSKFTKEYPKFLEVLITARMEQGLTRSDLSVKIDRPEEFVRSYESGEQLLTVLEWLEISDALHGEPMQLLRCWTLI